MESLASTIHSGNSNRNTQVVYNPDLNMENRNSSSRKSKVRHYKHHEDDEEERRFREYQHARMELGRKANLYRESREPISIRNSYYEPYPGEDSSDLDSDEEYEYVKATDGPGWIVSKVPKPNTSARIETPFISNLPKRKNQAIKSATRPPPPSVCLETPLVSNLTPMKKPATTPKAIELDTDSMEETTNAPNSSEKNKSEQEAKMHAWIEHLTDALRGRRSKPKIIQALKAYLAATNVQAALLESWSKDKLIEDTAHAISFLSNSSPFEVDINKYFTK